MRLGMVRSFSRNAFARSVVVFVRHGSSKSKNSVFWARRWFLLCSCDHTSTPLDDCCAVLSVTFQDKRGMKRRGSSLSGPSAVVCCLPSVSFFASSSICHFNSSSQYGGLPKSQLPQGCFRGREVANDVIVDKWYNKSQVLGCRRATPS